VGAYEQKDHRGKIMAKVKIAKNRVRNYETAPEKGNEEKKARDVVQNGPSPLRPGDN